VRWKTRERELYDLQKDPYELENIEDKADPVTLARLKTRLQMLSACRGSTCRAGEGP
jgi:N-acetylglucosamine-6-sulfatase